MVKFVTKKGEPTAYGFACGHIMIAENKTETYTDNGKRITLGKDGGVYHLQSIDWTKCILAGNEPATKGWNDSAKFRVWLCFDKLTDAKKAFYAECRRLNLTPKHRMPK